MDVWGDVLPRSYTFMEAGVGAGGTLSGPLEYPEIVASDVEAAASMRVLRARQNYAQGDAGRPGKARRADQEI